MLEVLLGGLALTHRAGRWFAVTGAPCEVSVDGRHRAFGEPGGCPRAAPSAGRPATGAAHLRRGRRRRSTSTRSSGPGRPTRWRGSGRPRSAPATCSPWGMRARPPAAGRHPAVAGGAARCGLLPGPRADWFVAGDGTTSGGAPYDVSRRLRPGRRCASTASRCRWPASSELPSEGIVLGAVQVPPDGQPVVFLADHPTTGGYPVVAVVDEADLWLCAQLRPGDEPCGSRLVERGHAAERGSSTLKRAHRARRRLGGLEADGHDAAARPPDPARPMLLVHDVHTRRPARAASGRWGGPRRLLARRAASIAEEVLLDPVGQPGHAHPEQPDAAGGVEVAEQRAGQPGDRRRRVGGGGQRGRAASAS